MGKFLLGVGILLTLLVLGFGVTAYANGAHVPITQSLQQAAQLSLSGNLDAAADLASHANDRWQAGWHLVAVFSDHAPMDEIDGLFAQLELYGKSGRFQDFAATAARLSALVEAMAEAHRPTWWNLL